MVSVLWHAPENQAKNFKISTKMYRTSKEQWGQSILVKSAFVLIKCNNLYAEQVIVNLKKIESVKEIQGTYGSFDILIKIVTNDAKDFDEIISTQIRTLENITSTVTLNLDNFKEN